MFVFFILLLMFGPFILSYFSYSNSSGLKKNTNDNKLIDNQVNILTKKNNSIDVENEKNKDEWISDQKEILIKNISLIELVNSCKINSISYSNLLKCFEWQFKRLEILVRDKFSCADCNVSSYKLHVHHKYYLKNFLPWEIENSALVALCRDCHANRHVNEQIHVYEKQNNKLVITNYEFLVCSRCQNTGFLPQYKHVENGICFKCNGNVINNSIFYNRILEIKNDQNGYNFNKKFDDSFKFLDSISTDFYKENLLNKIEKPSQNVINNYHDDLPF